MSRVMASVGGEAMSTRKGVSQSVSGEGHGFTWGVACCVVRVWVLGFGCCMLSVACWVLHVGCCMLCGTCFGCWVLGIAFFLCWVWHVVFCMLGVACWVLHCVWCVIQSWVGAYSINSAFWVFAWCVLGVANYVRGTKCP